MIKTNVNYKICNRCIMDTTAADISFDDDGVCSFCSEFLQRSSETIYKPDGKKQIELDLLISKIRKDGKHRPYDCIVGVSGGVDSSWVLVKTVELGLRPLAVHMDNGWNSELAQNNIANLVSKLKVDLHTYVVDWLEYKSLMQAFFDANVVDVELLYDNAMLAVNYQVANRYSIKHILAGTNQVTEGMKIPSGWNWFKYDKRNIYDIAKRYGVKRIKSFPAIGPLNYTYYKIFKEIKWHSVIDFLDFNKNESLKILESSFGYKRYPYKHYESIFTRFYQGFLLPQKGNIDKRRVHLSTLIISGQMSRNEAIQDLKSIPYPSEQDLQKDINYFLKKMDWTVGDLTKYVNEPFVAHDHYRSEKELWRKFYQIYLMFK